MADESVRFSSYTRIARWIAGIVLLCAAILVAFGTETTNVLLDRILGNEPRRAVRILLRTFIFSTPAGIAIGILLGHVVLLSSWLTQAAVRFLGVARWAPLLIWWVVGTQFVTLELGPRLWLASYGGVTVALTACYEVLATRFFLQLSLRDGIGRVVRGSLEQGIFIALILAISVVVEIWVGTSAKPPQAFVTFSVLAILMLLFNWASGYSFNRAASCRGTVLMAEVRHANWRSLLGALALGVACILLWQTLTGRVFYTSPVQVWAALRAFMSTGEIFRDVFVSFTQIAVGLAVGGPVAGILIFLMHRSGRMKNLIDGALQISQFAPIALLPYLFPGRFFGGPDYKWSSACVAVFCFYPFARAFAGLRGENIFRRVLLALAEALPYGGAAIIYGEAMFATSGLGFAMVIAGATFQVDKGMAVFLLLIFAIGLLSALLCWGARHAGLYTHASIHDDVVEEDGQRARLAPSI